MLIKRRFEPTYEELKGLLVPLLFLPYLSLSLPMRNWKAWNILTGKYRFLVWAYLWGIERCRKVRFSIWLIQFEPTYEELKVDFLKPYFKSNQRLSLPMRNWKLNFSKPYSPEKVRFEPTYEELKVSRRFARAPWANMFEPTYEELKDIRRNLL